MLGRNKVIENQKTRAQNFDDETDMVDAFVACGGRTDKTGHVKRSVFTLLGLDLSKVAPELLPSPPLPSSLLSDHKVFALEISSL